MTASAGDDLVVARKARLVRRWGRRRAVGRHPAEQAQLERELRTERIRHAISHGGMDTLLQPIIDLRSGRAVGAEALSRFRATPLRPPDAWFAEAASLGLGVELEMTAVGLALEQLHRLPPGLYLSLNASVETIMSEQFRRALADVPAERVVLELTEHTRVRDYGRLEETLRHLRACGIRLAVDDAGAGYASFRHVLNLHPDVIKLDIGLTRGIDRDPARQALGSALLTFGLNAINASIVAEGVETKGELDTLRSIGCPFGQGFYLGRPGRVRMGHAGARASAVLWLPEGATPTSGGGTREEQWSESGASTTTVAQVVAIEGPAERRPASATEDDGPSRAGRPAFDRSEMLTLAAEIRDLQRADEPGALVG